MYLAVLEATMVGITAVPYNEFKDQYHRLMGSVSPDSKDTGLDAQFKVRQTIWRVLLLWYSVIQVSRNE